MHRREALSLLAILGLGACQSSSPLAYRGSSADAESLQRVQAYLDGLHTLSARFLQTWPNGAVASGTVWLARPGQLRLQYDPPDTARLVASGGLVLYQDPVRHSSTSIPLANTPLAMLLADPIRLSGNVTVVDVRRLPGAIMISLVQTQKPDNGALTLTLTDPPLRIVGIRMVDARDTDTQLQLTGLQTGVPIDPGLFTMQAPLEPRSVNPATGI